MDLNELKPNSFKSKEDANKKPEKSIEKVVSGKVKRRAGSKEVKNLANEFVPGSIGSLFEYIKTDVFIPAIKKGLSDIVKNGIDILLYGDSRPKERKGPSERVSYNKKYYSRDYSDRDYRGSYESARHPTKGYGYDDVIIEDRGEAEEVLTRMSELIETYGTVSVADMYDLMGVTPEFTDNNYGWTDIRSAEVRRVREGYILKMPRAMPLD